MSNDDKIKDIGGFYNENTKVMLINVPKNASTSLRTCLKTKKHSRLTLLENYQEYKTIIVLRDPMRRIISQYAEVLSRRHKNTINKKFYKMKEGRDRFVEFLCEIERGCFDVHVVSQADRVCDSDGSLFKADYVFLMDTLKEDFENMKKELGLKCKLPHSKKTSGKKDWSHINGDQEIIEKVKKIYAKDFEIYNQVKNGR